MAARSPIMQAVIEEANKGRPVLGICNGFQVLTEAGLLPGALMRNACLIFVCRDAALTVANNRTLFTSSYGADQAITIPVAHHDGNFQADAETLSRIEGEGQVVFRYACTVNGSANNIAGLVNKSGNVLGMMPHPERAAEPAHGNEDGRLLFDSLVGALQAA
jgi:phosphoribosylformylglycinamidine synthase